jgi:hypothetical protein
MSDDTTAAAFPTTDDDAGWETVSREREPEIRITFDVIGDQFTGKYLGTRTIPTDTGSYTQYRFQDGADFYFINPLASLRDAMSRVRAGRMVRITYVSDMDTGQASPMKIFKVDVARPTR